MTTPLPATSHKKEDERLPWLDDAPHSTPSRNMGTRVGWTVGILIVVAGASYLAGLGSAAPTVPPTSDLPQAQVSAKLPDIPEPGPDIMGEISVPIVQIPAAAADAKVVEFRAKLAADLKPNRGSGQNAATTRGISSTVPVNDPYPLWPSVKVDGADGRLVRIGDFNSTADAHDGWQKVLGEYPGMARLKPVVTASKSLRDGRTFYSLQLGTSSQAHSQVVCERSKQLELRCAVVGMIVSETR